MPDDDRDDARQAWENEYEAWCEEQDAREVETMNALLRAISDGTVYDPREHHADK